MMRWDIINKFIQDRNYKNYLEIGYYKGWSFDKVFCENKIAVDPNPSKTTNQVSVPEGVGIFEDVDSLIWKMTSDKFFENEAMNYNKFDIIFIDGLHESSQVYKDIQNSLKYLNPNGVIVLHDCNPPRYEHTTTGIDGCWTGDTYKAVLRFQNENKRIPFYTIDSDWGVGIIDTSLKPNELDSDKDYLKAINDWNYFEDNKKDLLNLRMDIIK